MTTIDSDSADKRPARPPISVHPAFPGIVALWFAALLGLGSTILPAALLDRLVAGTGLAAFIPAAAPPLGFTARALVAVAAAVLGATVGIAVARRVARSHANTSTGIGAGEAGSQRPISVHEEIGGEGLVNGRGVPLNRHRAMEIAEDEGPSDFPNYAPLPDEILEEDRVPPQAFADEWDDEWIEEPLDLAETIEPADDQKHEEPGQQQEFQPPAAPADEKEPAQIFRRAVDGQRREATSPVNRVEPLHFEAPSLTRRTNTAANEDEPPTAADTETPELHGDRATAPLDKLALGELVERLGATIERRRESIARTAAQPIAAVPSPALPAELEAAPPEDAAQAMADYFATARAPDSVNLLEAPVEDGEDQGEDNGELSEDRYSSLLAMGHPSVDARATFPAEDRAFDPPGDTTETAPAPAPHTVDTDAALRAALATLQRMSGAA